MSNDTRPEIRFPGFTEDWEERKLGELTESFDGKRVPIDSDLRISGKYPYYGATGIIDYVDDYIFNGEYVLLAEDGANIIMRNYPVAYLTQGKFWLNNHAHIMRMRNGSNYFLVQVLEKIDYKKYNTGTAQPKLNSKIVKNIELKIPHIEEQQQIGNFFKQLDDIIALHQRKLDLLKETKKGFLQKMFPKNGAKVPEIRFPGFTEAWELCKLGRIFDVHTDFVSNGSFQSLKNNVRFYNDENYAYMIRLQDASNNWRGPWLYTDKHGFDFLKKSTVYENDILMSDRGTIGKFFLVPKLDRPMTLSSNAVLLRSSNCNNNFIYYMLNTIDIGNQIKKRTTPGVQPMISKTEFKKIITKLPVKEEQKKIGNFFKQLDDTITLHQRKLDLLKEMKKGFLQKMFV
ncbi:type I restriction enzyme, S subunit [Enterococcus sp. DIV0421]|uniref:restriction endonuclease subunit S n=1 Tax=Enterococcus sp. DIV0421 TaxID=2774688 RepID=UPI003F29867E